MSADTRRQLFKDLLFHQGVVEDLADRLARVHAGFGREAFVTEVMAELPDLELTGRSTLITGAIARHLPGDFPDVVARLIAALGPDDGESSVEGTSGFRFMPFVEYVGRHGLGHFETSMAALAEMTRRFSAEFAIRFFIRELPGPTFERLLTFASDPDPRVRRLASEGSRPRLPWSFRLDALVRDPSPTLPILERLKDDPDPVVRRSVANHLNDIAKDHPRLVLDLAARWSEGATAERLGLVRHALRTLVKAGHPEALTLLGAAPTEHVHAGELRVSTPTVTFGEALVFSFRLTNDGAASERAVLTYAVHHRKANGGLAPKVFRLSTRAVAPGASEVIERRHPMRPISTRRYYPGEHAVEVFVNGVSGGRVAFVLEMPGGA